MFERFTSEARHVVVRSQEEARLLDHNYIGSEHILLGLLAVGDGLAAHALDRCGVTLDSAREHIRGALPTSKVPPGGHIPFTPRSKRVLELSLREALAMGHSYIGTEHLLLGLLREGEGVGAQTVAALAGDLSRVRVAVLGLAPPAETAPGRRWQRPGPRRTSPVVLGPHRVEPDELRATPAADSSLDQALRLAGTRPVGTQHLLLAALSDARSAATRALTEMGVDLDQARRALSGVDVTGTDDELPEEAGRRQMLVRIDGDRLVVDVADPALVQLARSALQAAQRVTNGAPVGPEPTSPQAGVASPQAGSTAGALHGDQPLARSLSAVWLALHDSLEDVRRRAAAMHRPDAAPGQGSPGQGSTGQGSTGQG